MKHLKKVSKFLLLLLTFILLTKCESKGVNFTKISDSKIQGVSPIVSVDFYSITCNPKANSIVTVTLSDGSKYESERISIEKLSSLMTVLSSDGLSFNTESEEFMINSK